MKKTIKKFLKWILFVYISFTIIFTIMYMIKINGIVSSIAYKIQTIDKPYVYSLESEKLEEIIKNYQEKTDKIFDQYKDSKQEKTIEIYKLYEKYPIGTTLFLNQIASANIDSEMYVTSIILGITLGTIAFFICLIKNTGNIKSAKEIKNIEKNKNI